MRFRRLAVGSATTVASDVKRISCRQWTAPNLTPHEGRFRVVPPTIGSAGSAGSSRRSEWLGGMSGWCRLCCFCGLYGYDWGGCHGRQQRNNLVSIWCMVSRGKACNDRSCLLLAESEKSKESARPRHTAEPSRSPQFQPFHPPPRARAVSPLSPSVRGKIIDREG